MNMQYSLGLNKRRAIHNLRFRNGRNRRRKRRRRFVGARKHGGEEVRSLLYIPPSTLSSRQTLGCPLHRQHGDNQERTYMSDSIQIDLVKVAYFTSVGGTIQIIYLSKSTNKTLLKVSKIKNVRLNV